MFASNRPGGRIVLLMGLVLAFASVSTAQDYTWEGPAALAIEVRGDDGKPVEGATILLRVADRTPPVGPPAVTTDDHGRAVISHLGELEWYVEVSHESFMVYAAYIKVKADKKPVTGFSSQVNTATSWTPMRIKFAKAKSDFTRKLTKKERRAERQIADLEHRAPEARQPVSSPAAATPPVVPGQTPQSPPPASQPSTATTIEARQPAPVEETPASPSGPAVAATVAAEADSQPEEETETVEPTAASAAEAAAEQAAIDAAAQEAADQAAAQKAAEQAAAQEAAEQERSDRVAAEKAAAQAAAEAAAEQAAADAAAKQATERAAAEARVAELAVAREAAAKAAAEQAAVDKAAAEAAAQDAAEEQRAAAEAAELEAAERAESQAQAAAQASAERIAAEEAATRAAEEAAAAEQLAATEAAEFEAAEQAATEAEAAAKASAERIATEEAARRAAEQQAAAKAARVEAAEPSVAEATASAPKPPAATPAAPRPIPSYMASADLGTCAGCQPGEWSMIDQETVANARSNRTGTCPADPDAILSGIRQLVESVEPSFTGTISAALIPSRYAPVDREARAEIRQRLGAYLQATSTCRLVGVLLPADSKFAGYQYEAWSAAGGGACVAGLDCAVGRARWNDEPAFVEGPVTAIFALFHNRSERYDRRARFTVYFVPPSPDWTP